MDIRWEVDIVTPNMTSERSFFKVDVDSSHDLIQYDLFVSHQKNGESHQIKCEVFLNDVIMFDQEGFESIDDAKVACFDWVVKARQKKKIQ